MAQVIKINNLQSIPGADRLMLTLLAPLGLPVVVGIEDFTLGGYGVYIPAGTVIPERLRSVIDSNNGVIEPKVLFGQESVGVIVPCYWLDPSFVAANDPAELVRTGMNVGSFMGCQSALGTAHFGGIGPTCKLTAEVDNATGEVVGLFADGQILLRKQGRSNLVGPMAANGVTIQGGQSEADKLVERLDDFAAEVDEFREITDEAVELFQDSKEHLGELVSQLSAEASGTAAGVAAGFRMAANTAREAMVEALVKALGPVQAAKIAQYMVAHVSVELAERFSRSVEVFDRMMNPGCSCGPGEGCSDCPREGNRAA